MPTKHEQTIDPADPLAHENNGDDRLSATGYGGYRSNSDADPFLGQNGCTNQGSDDEESRLHALHEERGAGIPERIKHPLKNEKGAEQNQTGQECKQHIAHRLNVCESRGEQSSKRIGDDRQGNRSEHDEKSDGPQ